MSATAELKNDEDSKEKRVGLREELWGMIQAMKEEEGLINHAQAALFLEVSTRRIGELVETGKLRRFNFLGRTYVSVREVLQRRDSDIKAGRPPRNKVGRLKTAGKVLANYDLPNLTMELVVSGGIKEEKKPAKKK